MTEDEAKTKWCPFVRIGSELSGLGSLNRDVQLGENTMQVNCIASACMAWRDTSVTTRPYLDGKPIAEGMTIHPQGRPVEHRPVRNGFCGLAGEPRT